MNGTYPWRRAAEILVAGAVAVTALGMLGLFSSGCSHIPYAADGLYDKTPRGAAIRAELLHPTISKDCEDAPVWPESRWNVSLTCTDGVLVLNGAKPTLADRAIARVEYREMHRAEKRINVTLVEGRQEVPLGVGGRVVAVTCTANVQGSWPGVSCTTAGVSGTSWSYMPATLPMVLRVRVPR